MNYHNNKTLVWWMLGILLVSVVVIYFFLIRKETTFATIQVTFFDVGQGDSILVMEGNRQVLIDGGENAYTLREHLGRSLPWGDRFVEVLIPTHPDSDHMGSFPDVFDGGYDVGILLESLTHKETKRVSHWNAVKQEQSLQSKDFRAGDRIIFPSGATLEILFPASRTLGEDVESNDASIVSRLDFGEHCFLFTGDITKEKEMLLPQESCDVLKVAHHGSKYSTSEMFLKSINPNDAIISVGKNSYGHPSQDTLNRLRKEDVRVLRTDELGTIEYMCTKEECSLSRTL